jgi:hypothetical protein
MEWARQYSYEGDADFLLNNANGYDRCKELQLLDQGNRV